MKPILFNTEMVRAILDNRKTVTRRVIKQPLWAISDSMEVAKNGEMQALCEETGCHAVIKPPYKKGDILYVRETWNRYQKRIGRGKECHLEWLFGYKASPACSETLDYPWKPSIHMSKEAARIFLRVTDVKVERLQDISHGGMTKEGIELPAGIVGGLIAEYSYLRSKFTATWNSTIKKKDLDKYGWDANPWVWVIEFERVKGDLYAD